MKQNTRKNPETIKVGDIVYLKSGGPKMTVRFAQNPESITTNWFDGDHKLQSGYFHIDTLGKVAGQ